MRPAELLSRVCCRVACSAQNKVSAAVPKCYPSSCLLWQVHLDSGHVLPYHVVATDYASWALICTTSASLGGQRPAQVLCYAIFQMHVEQRTGHWDTTALKPPALLFSWARRQHGLASC
jgi:hypothetical protein